MLEYEYVNLAIVKAETSSDAYYAALNLPEIKDYNRIVDDDPSHYKTFDKNLNFPKEFYYEKEKYDIISILSAQCLTLCKNSEDAMSDY